MSGVEDSALMSSNTESPDQALRLIENLIKGGSFASAFGMNEKKLNVVYALGYAQYQQHRFEEAQKIFGFILMNDPFHVPAIRAMGSCMQMQGKYEQALIFLTAASVAEEKNADVTLQIVECLMHLGQKDKAESLLSEIRAALINDPQDEYIHQKADALGQFLSKAKEPVTIN